MPPQRADTPTWLVNLRKLTDAQHAYSSALYTLWTRSNHPDVHELLDVIVLALARHKTDWNTFTDAKGAGTVPCPLCRRGTVHYAVDGVRVVADCSTKGCVWVRP